MGDFSYICIDDDDDDDLDDDAEVKSKMKMRKMENCIECKNKLKM